MSRTIHKRDRRKPPRGRKPLKRVKLRSVIMRAPLILDQPERRLPPPEMWKAHPHDDAD